MTKDYIDGLLAYVDGEMTPQYRAVIAEELKQVEANLIRHRAELEEWEGYAHRARTEEDAPEDIRVGTLKTLEIKRDLVRTAERYRAFLINEIQAQPQYKPAFEYKN
ncbi:hypothetical protein ACQVP2_33225 [Methylobacterium aquaticum]|uniref:hypothetical protein n=1 Tax=Methylobacterium aquaticum TaxID=270351 RepID=UPI003D1657EE